MTTTIVTPDQDTIIAEIQIAAPPERVFKAISDEGELMRWFSSSECLTPRQGGTRVRVTHSGLASLPVARKDYSGGWTGVVEQLKKFVEK